MAHRLITRRDADENKNINTEEERQLENFDKEDQWFFWFWQR